MNFSIPWHPDKLAFPFHVCVPFWQYPLRKRLWFFACRTVRVKIIRNPGELTNGWLNRHPHCQKALSPSQSV